MGIFEFLDESRVPYKVLEHRPVFSAQRLAQIEHGAYPVPAAPVLEPEEDSPVALDPAELSPATAGQVERAFSQAAAALYEREQALRRAAPGIIARNQRGQSGLWRFAISGDLPIMLLHIGDLDRIGVVRQALQAHAYWRKRGLKIDLVIMNQRQASYNQDLRDQLHRLLALTHSEIWINQRGGIFLLNSSQLLEDDRMVLETAARVVLDTGTAENGGSQTSLVAQLDAPRRRSEPLPPFAPARPLVAADVLPVPPVAQPVGLAFDNGLGGFSADGREYLIYLEAGQQPPLPWVNVIANPEFGFLVSESGSSYTWSLNSGENRLTPWSNDPVTDPVTAGGASSVSVTARFRTSIQPRL